MMAMSASAEITGAPPEFKSCIENVIHTGILHGTHEKIAISNYVDGISYYIQLMKNFGIN